MATRRWLGRAVKLKDIKTITVANTWATADTCTVTINGKDLVVTVGTDATTAQVATLIKEAFNGDTQTGTGDHTSSPTFSEGGGSVIPEFTEMTASVSGSVVTLTATDNAAGKPITVSVTESTAGDGTATLATTTAGTGPNDWSNADNWSGDTVPVDGDTVVYDSGDSDCLYNLSTGMQPAVLRRTASYTGKIGLHEVNSDNSGQVYDEYRTTYLTFTNDAGTAACAVTLYGGGGRTKLDFGDSTVVTVNVLDRDNRDDDNVPEILLKGTDSSTVVNVNRGDVGAAFYAGEAFTIATLREAFIDDPEGDSDIVLGVDATLSSVTITKTGGNLEVNSAFSAITQSGPGETVVNGSGNITGAQKIYAGVYRVNTSGTVSGVITSAGTGDVTFDGDPRAKTVSNPIEKYGSQSFVRDNNNVVASLIIDINETVALTGIEIGSDRRVTFGATA